MYKTDTHSDIIFYFALKEEEKKEDSSNEEEVHIKASKRWS
ncbi:uncharacterized protein METZ01_LOCUS363056 [marine metagenome]|uniref:Uncharacterized protein n=1 Tax=marine metagenome TaxID=408172 RepID=A0A382SKY0_9ZZZZ